VLRVVRFRWDDDEGDDWMEGNGLLDPLLEARSELAAGDLRQAAARERHLEQLAGSRPRRGRKWRS
jgi:hypothetical protein